MALGNNHTNTASVKTEVNLQVLLPPCPSSGVATASNATATIATARSVEINTDCATLNFYAKKVSFDLSRVRDNYSNSYSREELEEYNSDSDDGSYCEEMADLVDRCTEDCSNSSFSKSDHDNETFLTLNFDLTVVGYVPIAVVPTPKKNLTSMIAIPMMDHTPTWST